MSSGVSSSELYAVIPAAGLGSRMNTDIPKQYLKINGTSILDHTIERMLQIASLEKMVIVLDQFTYEQDSTMFAETRRVDTCVGGASRAESVRNGLLHLSKSAASDSGVMVHDAARPCVRVSEINRLITETATSTSARQRLSTAVSCGVLQHRSYFLSLSCSRH